eukprot:UC1_evm1s178
MSFSFEQEENAMNLTWAGGDRPNSLTDLGEDSVFDTDELYATDGGSGSRMRPNFGSGRRRQRTSSTASAADPLLLLDDSVAPTLLTQTLGTTGLGWDAGPRDLHRELEGYVAALGSEYPQNLALGLVGYDFGELETLIGNDDAVLGLLNAITEELQHGGLTHGVCGSDGRWRLQRRQAGLLWLASEDGLATATGPAFFVAMSALCEARRQLHLESALLNADAPVTSKAASPTTTTTLADSSTPTPTPISTSASSILWPYLGRPLRDTEAGLDTSERAQLAQFCAKDLDFRASSYAPGMTALAAISPRIRGYFQSERSRTAVAPEMISGPAKYLAPGTATLLRQLATARRQQVQLDCLRGAHLEAHLPSAIITAGHTIVGERVGMSALVPSGLCDALGYSVDAAHVLSGGTGGPFTADCAGDVNLQLLLTETCSLSHLIALQTPVVPEGYSRPIAVSVWG